MTSEEEERPRFVTGGYERHRRQWVNTLVKPVLLYGSETWKTNVQDYRKLVLPIPVP